MSGNFGNVIILTAQPKFELGLVASTPGASALLEELNFSASTLINRHAACDFGDLCPEDKETNEEAMKSGARIFSVYRLVDQAVIDEASPDLRRTFPTIWVITDAESESGHREYTTLLLPDEY